MDQGHASADRDAGIRRYWPADQPRSLDVPCTDLFFDLETSAARFPDKPAIVFHDSVVTFGELHAQACALGGYLQQVLGVRAGDRVLLFAQNSPQFVAAFHAVQATGAVVVPVSAMHKVDEVAHVAGDSGARVAIAATDLLPHIEPLVGGALDAVVLIHYADALPEVPADTPAWLKVPRPSQLRPGLLHWHEALAARLPLRRERADAEALAVLVYTSGTTGRPKGVMHSHRSIHTGALNAVAWRRYSSETVFFGTSPMFHTMGLQTLLTVPAYLGCTVVLMARWDAAAALELMAQHDVSTWSAAPAMVMDLLALPGFARARVPRLAAIGGGGAPMPAAVAQRLWDEHRIRYLEAYGMTETAAMVTANPAEHAKPASLGIPVFGVDARVVDPQTLHAVPLGEVGELLVHGQQVTQGYWRRPEADAECFVQINGRRFLRTGDLVREDEEGFLFLVDRLKRMINTAGFKVWPTEIEALLHQHPAVHEACVIGARDERRGHSVKALVVRREGSGLSADELMAWARERLAVYKVPRQVAFVERLPRSATGKVDWRRLQQDEDGI